MSNTLTNANPFDDNICRQISVYSVYILALVKVLAQFSRNADNRQRVKSGRFGLYPFPGEGPGVKLLGRSFEPTSPGLTIYRIGPSKCLPRTAMDC